MTTFSNNTAGSPQWKLNYKSILEEKLGLERDLKVSLDIFISSVHILLCFVNLKIVKRTFFSWDLGWENQKICHSVTENSQGRARSQPCFPIFSQLFCHVFCPAFVCAQNLNMTLGNTLRGCVCERLQKNTLEC